MTRSMTAFLAALALAGCATDPSRVLSPGMAANDVSARLGKPVAEGRLPSQEAYWDYTREPYGYYRVTFGRNEQVREVRDLHTEQNFLNLRPGMTHAEVRAIVGRTSWIEGHAGGAASWRYRYRDAGIAKLLHVNFDAGERLTWYYWEWDPEVYSKGDSLRM